MAKNKLTESLKSIGVHATVGLALVALLIAVLLVKETFYPSLNATPTPLARECVANGESCCKDGGCARVFLNCVEGTFPQFKGCDANCIPVGECVSTPSPIPLEGKLKSFKSWNEVELFLKAANAQGYGVTGGGWTTDVVMPMTKGVIEATTQSVGGGEERDYSTTNVQVEGVDEADVLKNDGEYLYTISGSDLIILKAFPPSAAKVVAVLNDSTYSQLFVYGDKIIAFGYDHVGSDVVVAGAEAKAMPFYDYPYDPGIQRAFIKVFDASEHSAPVLLKQYSFSGNYVESRLIDGRVYAVFTQYAYYGVMPFYSVDGVQQEIAASDVNYLDYPSQDYSFTTLVGFDLNDLNKTESKKIILLSGAQNLFVSKENAFITYTRYNYYYPVWRGVQPLLPALPEGVEKNLTAIDALGVSEWQKDNLKLVEINDYLTSLDYDEQQEFYSALSKTREKYYEDEEVTVIHKFGLGNEISYKGQGGVPGHVLNQFSMDEFGGFFRIATTVSEVQRINEGELSKNNVYVLNDALKVVGRLEDLAPGEKIYSARFMGNKAFLVTFKKVDPLFVIDLSEPTAPKLLGKLKIPGYSDYLHPYDENHLIGLGKDAVPAEDGDFAWYQGVKLSLFDVSDVSAPKEVASYEIGDRGTDSFALSEHKAFLFSKTMDLLVIPITLAEINEKQYPQGVESNHYGDYAFQGAYAFSVSPEKGFVLRGRVSHADEETFDKSGEFYWGGGTDVKRSAYIEDVLYTISDKFVKANDLNTFKQKASVKLPFEEQSVWAVR